jgi:hypothetical protein
MNHRLLRYIATAAAGFVLAGCTPSRPKYSCDLLAQVTREYARQIRWRETDLTLQKVAEPPEGGRRSAWKEALARIEVVECTVKEQTCTPDSASASNILAMEFVLKDSASLKKTDVTVDWRFDEKAGWQVISAPPKWP